MRESNAPKVENVINRLDSNVYCVLMLIVLLIFTLGNLTGYVCLTQPQLYASAHRHVSAWYLFTLQLHRYCCCCCCHQHHHQMWRPKCKIIIMNGILMLTAIAFLFPLFPVIVTDLANDGLLHISSINCMKIRNISLFKKKCNFFSLTPAYYTLHSPPFPR